MSPVCSPFLYVTLLFSQQRASLRLPAQKFREAFRKAGSKRPSLETSYNLLVLSRGDLVADLLGLLKAAVGDVEPVALHKLVGVLAQHAGPEADAAEAVKAGGALDAVLLPHLATLQEGDTKETKDNNFKTWRGAYGMAFPEIGVAGPLEASRKVVRDGYAAVPLAHTTHLLGIVAGLQVAAHAEDAAGEAVALAGLPRHLLQGPEAGGQGAAGDAIEPEAEGDVEPT